MKLIVDTYDRAVIPNIVDNTLFYDRKVQCKRLPKEKRRTQSLTRQTLIDLAFSQVQRRYARMKYKYAQISLNSLPKKLPRAQRASMKKEQG